MAFARRSRRLSSALWLDKWLGPLLCAALVVAKRLRPAAAPLDPATVRRVLIVKMWGMGSIVLASAVLREIRRRFPNARIDFATLAENREILECVEGVDGRILLDLSSGVVSFLVRTLGALWRVRRERYDLLLDFEFFTRFSAIFSFLARARASYGFSAKGSMRGRLHDAEIPFNTYNHVVLNFLSLLRGTPVEPLPTLDLSGPEVLPRLAIAAADRKSIEHRLLHDSAWREGRPLVVVNPNAGDLALERRWPEERMTALLRRLCACHDANVVLIGGSGERDYVAGIIEAAGLRGRVVDLAGAVRVPELVALFERADAVLSNDSGPLHVAAASGASVVGLYGPETPVLYGPLRSRPQQRHAVHYRHLACSPCMFVHDNKVLSCWFADALCMHGIGEDEVLASLEKLLASRTGA